MHIEQLNILYTCFCFAKLTRDTSLGLIYTVLRNNLGNFHVGFVGQSSNIQKLVCGRPLHSEGFCFVFLKIISIIVLRVLRIFKMFVWFVLSVVLKH